MASTAVLHSEKGSAEPHRLMLTKRLKPFGRSAGNLLTNGGISQRSTPSWACALATQ